MTEGLDPAFFRHEYGRIVAMLARRIGVRHLASIEDAVQTALLTAVEDWPRTGLPENPSGWLFRVAENAIVGDLRTRARRERLGQAHAREERSEADPPEALLAGEVEDDLLRMLFACCDDAIPIESQLVLALKTLCGFSVTEIAERLFVTEANVYKRLGRARERLRDEHAIDFGELGLEALASRRPAVQAVLYLLFTEGWLSAHAEGPIRRELCAEAKRLALVLVAHPAGATPDTFALVALLHLHLARMPARQDATGGLLLLEEQDRLLWDADEIARGLAWLARSAEGPVFSRWHAEAGIAAEHCLAASFAETRWDRIVASYELLERAAPSPLHTLNRALAVAELSGPRAGLAVLERLAPPSWLEGSYPWSAVLCDLHARAGDAELARTHRVAALATAPEGPVRRALERRLGGS